MSAPVHKAGSAGPFLTVISKSKGDKSSATFTIEGTYSDLDELTASEIAALLPADYQAGESHLEPVSVGMGRLLVKAARYDSSAAGTDAFIRSTFAIEMAEVTYDLVNHPMFSAGERDVIRMWLATDEAERKEGNFYTYKGRDGLGRVVMAANVEKFCAAYMAGITTFNRYYPVIEKSSAYSNPPGMTMSGGSFTGGTPTFSAGIGTYDAPPLTLNGYPSTNWFKSKDSWQENVNRTWTRTEHWTYTPEGSSGDHAWIYGGTPGGNNGNGGAA